MKLAILADIHGNLPALEAVISALERIQPDYVIVNGDLINGTPFSVEVVDCIRSLDWVVLRGNHEFYLLDLGTPRAVPGSDDPRRWGQLHWLAARMRPDQVAYLAMLPDICPIPSRSVSRMVFPAAIGLVFTPPSRMKRSPQCWLKYVSRRSSPLIRIFSSIAVWSGSQR
jgi:hypothetical protein